MPALTRRMVLAAAAAAASGPAFAQDLVRPAFDPGQPWRRGRAGEAFPLDAALQTAAGQTTLGEILAGRPAVINLWATWCPPCLFEKPALNAFATAMNAQGGRFAVVAILAYDRGPRDWQAVEKAYARHGDALQPLRATRAAEDAFLAVFGAGADRNRTSLPQSVLLDAAGVELGRIDGAAVLRNGRMYWREALAQDMADRLLAT